MESEPPAATEPSPEVEMETEPQPEAAFTEPEPAVEPAAAEEPAPPQVRLRLPAASILSQHHCAVLSLALAAQITSLPDSLSLALSQPQDEAPVAAHEEVAAAEARCC